jgi:hypothetical protein
LLGRAYEGGRGWIRHAQILPWAWLRCDAFSAWPAAGNLIATVAAALDDLGPTAPVIMGKSLGTVAATLPSRDP